MSAIHSEISGSAAWPANATQRMNRMYRWQRHFYDMTRRHYLLGRDQMIDGLKPAPRARVLEIGCGTGTQPDQGGASLSRGAVLRPRRVDRDADVGDRIDRTRGLGRPGQGRARRRDRIRSEACVRRRPFDHIMISYCLSMIPEWQCVLEVALHKLAPGGSLHIVDFGGQQRLPTSARRWLRRWLALFDVTPRDDLERTLLHLAEFTARACRSSVRSATTRNMRY